MSAMRSPVKSQLRLNSPETTGRSQLKPITPAKLGPAVTQAIEITLPNGDTYEGQDVGGAFNGKGKYFYNAQRVLYDGQFEAGRPHGFGYLVKIDPRTKEQSPLYEGSWVEGYRDGSGKYYYPNGATYTGTWLSNIKSGQGIYSDSESVYNGSWAANQREGKGILKLANGLQFEGTFAKDSFMKGRVIYPNKDEYEGEWVAGLRHGRGSYFCAQTSERYRGEWRSGVKHGQGTIQFANGDRLTGLFEGGMLQISKEVTYIWKDGTSFEGWFRDGQPNLGTIKTPVGDQYELKK